MTSGVFLVVCRNLFNLGKAQRHSRRSRDTKKESVTDISGLATDGILQTRNHLRKAKERKSGSSKQIIFIVYQTDRHKE